MPRIAALWTDLTVATRGEIKIEQSDDYFRVVWDDLGYMPPASGSASFAATLYENGWIALSYGDIDLVDWSLWGFSTYGGERLSRPRGALPGRRDRSGRSRCG